MTWAATQAKAKFSEMLDRAEEEGPQVVRRRKREFVVMTREQLSTMKAGMKKQRKSGPRDGKQTMADFFRNSPLRGSGVDLSDVRAKTSETRPLVSAWDALAPSFDERYDVDFPRLKGKLRKADLA